MLHDITLTVCDKENAQTLQTVAAQLGKHAKIHLKVDTGMGRIGVSVPEAPELARFIEHDCPDLDLEGIYTHLPVSDIKDQSYTKAQVERFKKVIEEIETKLGREIAWKHCANSGAVLGYEDAWLNMVRPGIMIYGYYPDKETPHTVPLKPGLSFYSSVISSKDQAAPRSVTDRPGGAADTWIATIPAGYGDGFNRLVVQPRQGPDQRALISYRRAGLHGSKHGRSWPRNGRKVRISLS